MLAEGLTGASAFIINQGTAVDAITASIAATHLRRATQQHCQTHSAFGEMDQAAETLILRCRKTDP
jgi:hypothetical protein